MTRPQIAVVEDDLGPERTRALRVLLEKDGFEIVEAPSTRIEPVLSLDLSDFIMPKPNRKERRAEAARARKRR